MGDRMNRLEGTLQVEFLIGDLDKHFRKFLTGTFRPESTAQTGAENRELPNFCEVRSHRKDSVAPHLTAATISLFSSLSPRSIRRYEVIGKTVSGNRKQPVGKTDGRRSKGSSRGRDVA
jgi:hypothetical protein